MCSSDLVRLGALKCVRQASDQSRDTFFDIRYRATGEVAGLRQAVPALLADVRVEARQAIRSADVQSHARLSAVLERSAFATRRAREMKDAALQDVSDGARRTLNDAAVSIEALMREIAGQGPDKTLGRGFAVVRRDDGTTMTSALEARARTAIQIQFHDGKVAAKTADEQGDEPP